MKFVAFTPKQMKILKWWNDPAVSGKYSALICDGAIRSGKTSIMMMSFIMWAMSSFNGYNFAVCGKTVQSAERNVLAPFMSTQSMNERYSLTYTRSSKLLTITAADGTTNRFYIFGGKDESSYTLIQGITLAGVFFDEVALMPESFVNQALARCSVEGSRYWFNCNPENPHHWFHKEWIMKALLKKALYLHFRMKDNPSLSAEKLAEYERMYSGVFRRRYIEGEWVAPEGLVYPMYEPEKHNVPPAALPKPEQCERIIISIDYGTQNPCVFSKWGEYRDVHYLLDEYYHSGRETHNQLTDDEYYTQLTKFAGKDKIDCIIVDPSAASFITLIRKKGRFTVRGADNSKLDGIRECSTALKQGIVMFNSDCKNSLDEFTKYRWDETLAAKGIDEPKKEDDHFCDSFRYYVKTMRIAQGKFKRLGEAAAGRR